MIIPWIAVALGGSIGALFRYAVTLWAQSLWGLYFPYGTLIVNTVGSFLAGFFLTFFVARFSAGELIRLFFVTGFLGGLTTFSSFTVESLFMFQRSQWGKLLANVMLNNLGCLVMALIGCYLANSLISGYLNQHQV